MKTTNILRPLVLTIFFCFVSGFMSGNEKNLNQYSDYYQYWNFSYLLENPTGGGGGSLYVDITDDVLTVTFSAGFSANKLKNGNVVSLATTPGLPDMELGFLTLKNGTTGYNYAVKVSIVSSHIYFQHTAYHNLQTYTSITGTYTVDLSSGTGGGDLPPTGNLSSEYNYTHNIEPSVATTDISVLPDDQKLESVTYFDGLGRPIQEILIRGGAGQEDLVTPLVYDSFGRRSKEYLPFPEENDPYGSYRSGTVLQEQENYYTAEYPDDFTTGKINPFSEKRFEASPLNRPLEQGAPGSAWKISSAVDDDHTVKFEYGTNTFDPANPSNLNNDNVRSYTVSLASDFTPTLVASGYYEANQLYKNITRDENWKPAQVNPREHTTEEFTDKQGRVVLKRTFAATDENNDGDTTDSNEQQVPHDTYYVYDDYGNLSYVIPPKVVTSDGISATELSELCYQYRYDSKNRIIEKKIPGKGTQTNWESNVYNKLDQPIMTQDPNLKAQGKWLFTKYDAFGRVVYTGMVTRTVSRATLQAEADNNAFQFEERSSVRNLGGTSVYYTNNAYPKVISETLTQNYYDTYLASSTQAGITVPASNSLGEAITTATKGLPTVSKVRVLGTSSWITTVNAYEKKGRQVWSKSDNPYLQTTDMVESDIDFPGNVLVSKTTHTRTNMPTIITTDNFTYDHVNRLKKHTQSINGAPAEVIAENDYNALGQLVNKGVGNKASNGTRLQEIIYSYNVRGWLKKINDVGNLDKLFNFSIFYNDGTGTDLFNGNISQVQWRTDNEDSGLKTYHYYYDALNRINRAADGSDKFHLGSIAKPVGYDKNGNITSLLRMGWTTDSPNLSANTGFGTMDDLLYYYNGNKLMKVNDRASIDPYGFGDDITGSAADSTNDYTYDVNGNLTSDANKGILTGGIKYNHLNLPTEVKFNNSTSQVIKYTYDATGVKLRKEIPGKITDYAGNFIYEGGTLQFFNHPEGYVSYDGGQFNYVYNYKDHLGNVRLSYTDANQNNSNPINLQIIQEKNYYPFGLTHKGYNTGGSPLGNAAAKRFGFGGKELQDENISGSILDWYDISARNYDPAIGRWMNIDPLAEQMRRYSPYNYAFDNPIYFVDPDGMAPACTTCPWPNAFGELRSLSNYVGNKIDSNLKSLGTKINNIGNSISNALDFEPKGGVVGYADSGFTKNGLVEPRKAQPGDDVTYADLTGVMVAAEIYGPQLENKIAEGTKIASDLLSTFLDPSSSSGSIEDSNTAGSASGSNNNLEVVQLTKVERWSVGTPFGMYSETGLTTTKDTMVDPSTKQNVVKKQDSINNSIKEKAREKYKSGL